MKKMIGVDKYIIDLVIAGLEKNSDVVELAALSLARSLKKEDSELSKKINNAISSHINNPGFATRSIEGNPIPTDSDSHLEMARVVSPSQSKAKIPILNSLITERIATFIEERECLELLIEKGLKPSSSLLLIGEPGTGKTMLANYISNTLNKPLIILDLSTSISSLMGKTGHNLKRVLQYAKQTSSVLLLDEFDAIAKKRDDNIDLGEMKRVVNVLLMEMENWPISSILIATTNYPELLDKAIWRRFDHSIEINLPEIDQVISILEMEFDNFLDDENKVFVKPIAEILLGKSAADICKFSNNAKRRSVIKKENIIVASIHELELYTHDKKIRGKFCCITKELLGESISVRKIAELTGLSASGVQHHINKIKTHGKQLS